LPFARRAAVFITAFSAGFKKEKAMRKLALALFVALLHVAGYSSAQQKVDMKGVTPAVKLEAADFGYLGDLKGKYKLRVTELVFEPGGYLGGHHHVGPGIRYVVSGELTRVVGGKTLTHKAGEYWYTAGDMTGSGSNKTKLPARVISFELLPADLKGGSVIPPKNK
jgi:quercetin dioxygenase-like cupin family protein